MSRPAWVRLIGALLFFPQILFAQISPRLTVQDGDANVVLELQELDIEARVIGNRATTTLEMTFVNLLGQDVTGKLDFPLPKGATVSRYARDVNGLLREGVMVRKAEPEPEYATMWRQAVQPGASDAAESNVFEADIPLVPAKSKYHVVVAYEEVLRYAEGDDFYACPLAMEDEVARFSFVAIAEDQPFAPVMRRHGLGTGHFGRKGNGYRMSREALAYVPNEPITLILPINRQEAQIFTEPVGNQTYFYLRNVPGREPIQRKMPRTVCLAWDVSRSGEFRDHTAELELLDRYFKEVGDFTLKLLTFSHAVHATKVFEVKNGRWDEARNFLSGQSYDGATQLGMLNISKWVADEILLLTDGKSTFGQSATGWPSIPVYIIHAAPSAADAQMAYLARRTQGAYVNLVEKSQAEGLDLLLSQPYAFISAKFQEDRFTETFPAVPVTCRESFSMAGILQGKSGKLELRFGYGNTVIDRLKYDIRRSGEETSTAGLERLWAQKKLADLMLLQEENASEIMELGLSHQLETPYTTLKVLDLVKDYIDNEVDPPGELQVAYNNMVTSQKEMEVRQELAKAAREVDRMEDILDDYMDVVDWWKAQGGNQIEKSKSGWRRPQDRMFRIYGGAVAPRPALPWPAATVPGDSIRKVRGRVIDEISGRPLAGVTLTLDGSKSMTVTDSEGNFLLVVYKIDRILTLELAGYPIQDLYVDDVGPEVTLEMVSDAANVTPEVVAEPEIGPVTPPPDVSGSVEAAPAKAMVMLDGRYVDGNMPTDRIVRSEYVQSDRAMALYGPAAAHGLLVHMTSAGDLPDNFLALPVWNPTMPYMDTLRVTAQWERYALYLRLREIYGASPAFFLDVADFFLKAEQEEEGLRILSNLVELDLGHHESLRALAYYLQGMNQPEAALSAFRKVKAMRPGEPQSSRDLALALWDVGEYQAALDQFDEMLRTDWSGVDDLFGGIERIALMEMNTLIATSPVPLDLSHIDQRMIQALPVKLRVVVDWNRIDTDVDVSILDGKGRAISGPRQQSSVDMVDGYGPETFLMRNAAPGEYQVQVNYFDEADYNDTGQTLLKVTVYTNYGTAQQKRQVFTHRMGSDGEGQRILKFQVD